MDITPVLSINTGETKDLGKPFNLTCKLDKEMFVPHKIQFERIKDGSNRFTVGFKALELSAIK